MQLWAPPRVPIQIQCANCNCSNVITFVETDGEKERSTLTQVQLNLGLSWPYLATAAVALNRLAKPFIVCHHHQHRISGRILKIIQHNHNSRGGFEYCVKERKQCLWWWLFDVLQIVLRSPGLYRYNPCTCPYARHVVLITRGVCGGWWRMMCRTKKLATRKKLVN